MQLDKYLIALIVISIFAVTFGNFYVSTTKEYGVTVDSQYQESFDKLNETYIVTEQLSQDIKGASVEEGTTDWDVGKTIKAGLNAIKLVFIQGLPAGIALIGSIPKFIPVPINIILGLQAILIIVMAFVLVYLYFRFQNQ